LNIQFSQGSAATHFRWGGRSNTIFIRSSSTITNTTVKELLKSDNDTSNHSTAAATYDAEGWPCIG